MRLPNTAQTSRPWRIHELTRDFRLEDVWELPTPGGPRDFHWLVSRPSAVGASLEARRALRLGPTRHRRRLTRANAARPHARRLARRAPRSGLRGAPLYLAIPA